MSTINESQCSHKFPKFPKFPKKQKTKYETSICEGRLYAFIECLNCKDDVVFYQIEGDKIWKLSENHHIDEIFINKLLQKTFPHIRNRYKQQIEETIIDWAGFKNQ